MLKCDKEGRLRETSGGFLRLEYKSKRSFNRH